jgi:hypothetical protein
LTRLFAPKSRSKARKLATSQEAISRLSIQSTLTGEAEVTAGLKRISAAQDGVAVSSSSTEKATVSLEKSFASIERRYVAGVAAQQQYEKIQRQVNAAVAQNPALQERANAILAAAAQRHDALSNSQKAMGVVANDLNSRIQANAGSFGVLGQAMSALGPVGVGVAAVIGVVIGAMYAMSSAAHALAEKAKELREFSEATGLTTIQFQALRSEAGKFGVDAETLSKGLTKFTAGYDDLRKGGGNLLTDIRKINPALAEQMQVATDSATAFTLFGQAVQQTSNIFERNALLKAGMGRGSAVFGAFFESAPDVNKLASSFAAAGKGIDDGLIKRLSKLQVEIDKTTAAAKNTFASIFAESTLQEEKTYAEGLLTIATRLKEISNAKAPSWLSQAIRVAQTGSFDPATQARTSLRQGMQVGAESSSIAEIISDAVPRTRSHSQIVSDSFIGPTAPAAKTAEALAADLKNLIGVLGSAAAPSERLAASIAELGIKAKEAGLGADILARGIAGLKLDDAIARQSAHNATLGAAASVTDIMKEKTLSLTKARQQDSTLTDAQIANVMRVAKEQALGTYQIQTQIDGEKTRIATLFMGTEAATSYATSQSIINKAIQDGKPLNDNEIDQIKAKADALAKVKVQGDLYADMTRTAQQSAASFSNDLISGLGQGQTAVESLHNAFKNLASTLTSSALKSLLDGDFISVIWAGIKGIAAAAAAIFSANTSSSGEKWLKQQTESRDSRLSDVAQRSAMIGVDTNTRAGAILAQDAEFHRQRIAENKANGLAMNSLLQVQVQERNQLLKDWDQKDIDLVKANADAKLAIEKAANDRALGFQNRLFAATNDFSTLEGQLAAFDRTASQERLVEAANDNAKLADLDAASAAERFNVIKSYNEKIVADAETTAKAQQDALNGTAKNIVEFVNGLYAGPSSTESPTARRAAAGTVYNTQLALAQTGDAGAQGRITQDAQNLLDAERAISASSEAFQLLKGNVAAQLLSLPAVQSTTDPSVQAMRDVLTAINIGNAALNVINTTTGGTTSAVNAANSVGTLTGVILPAVNAGNAANVAAALQSYFNQIDPSGKLSDIFSVGNSANAYARNTSDFTRLGNSNTENIAVNMGGTKVATLEGNVTLDAIRALQNTATSQLLLLTSALAPTSNAVTINYTTANAQTSLPTKDHTTFTDQMLTALYKIVVNTWATAGNTAYISGAIGRDGTRAYGGLVTGPGTATSDSITMGLSNREYVIQNASVEKFGVGFFDQLNAGIMPRSIGNDNFRPINVAAPVFRGGGNGDGAELRAIREELRAVRAELAAFRQENGVNTMRAARLVGDKVDDAKDTVKTQTGTLAAQERQSNRERKVANG